MEYKTHECDNVCITIFNNKDTPTLIDWAGYRMLVGVGDTHNVLINQLGGALPFFTSHIDALVLLNNATSTRTASNDLFKKYKINSVIETYQNNFLHYSTTTNNMSIEVNKINVPSRSKKASSKWFVEIQITNQNQKAESFNAKLDVNTTITQKKNGFGLADIVFLKNTTVPTKQGKHINGFIENTNTNYFVSTSPQSGRESKNHRIFEIISSMGFGAKILFPLKTGTTSNIFCTFSTTHLSTNKNHRMECGGKRKSFFDYLLSWFKEY